MDANRATAYSEYPTEDQNMKKSIIITGAGRGIGAATARTFLDNGYNVGLIGRNADTLAATADGHPNALVLPCDCLLYTSPSPRDIS